MADQSQDEWDSLTSLIEEFRAALQRSTAIHVSAMPLRDGAKKIVQQYFRHTRPHLIALKCQPDKVSVLDDEMQSLLKLANGKNRKQSYKKVLKTIRALQHDVGAEREINLGQRDASSSINASSIYSVIEQRILDTLQRLVPSAALSYQQALDDLQSTSRVSFRGVANELRESLREVLDHLAPDAEVMKAAGFKLEKDKTTPTHKQKVRHILRSRGISKTVSKTPEDSVSLIEESMASLARSAYERSSISTHIASARREVQQVKMYIDSVLAELLEIHK
ncbi:MAG: hypothetical protein WD823_13865 [Sulfuricaulis sp.]|uniref:pPIWI-associating nuclease domain-containing protein n=1 Tax=Sulfuricaulis sp. TaxID=2003553 RepID=UPI0034A3950F